MAVFDSGLDNLRLPLLKSVPPSTDAEQPPNIRRESIAFLAQRYFEWTATIEEGEFQLYKLSWCEYSFLPQMLSAQRLGKSSLSPLSEVVHVIFDALSEGHTKEKRNYPGSGGKSLLVLMKLVFLGHDMYQLIFVCSIFSCSNTYLYEYFENPANLQVELERFRNLRASILIAGFVIVAEPFNCSSSSDEYSSCLVSRLLSTKFMEFFSDVGGDPLKPSLFELVAQEQLRDLLQPALKYVLSVRIDEYASCGVGRLT